MTPIADKRLPSPRDWLFASRAYAQLALDWPAYARRIYTSNPQRYAALDATGGELEQAMRNIAALTTPTGIQGNKPLFTGVISYYNTKLTVMDSALLGIEAAFVQEQVNQLEQQTPFDLFGGLDQTLDFQSPGISTLNCGDPDDAGVPAPANLKAQTPNFNRYNLAEYLKFGTLSSCVSAILRNAQLICRPGQDVCDARGDLYVFVNASFGSVSLEQREMNLGKVTLLGEQSPTDYAIQHWGNLKPRFEAGSSSVSPTPALAKQRADLLSKTTTDIQTRLLGYQKALYTRLFDELTKGSLRSTALDLDGAKKLLDSFVTLGLPSAVDNDDFMRSLLYSDQRIIDYQLLSNTYAVSATQALTATHVRSNPRLVLQELAGKRRDALDTLLKRYLDAITARTYSEDISMIANARFQLRLGQRLSEVAAPEPVTGRYVLLPLIQH